MNKLSKRLGAVGLAAALAFTFMPATALASTTGTITNNKITVTNNGAVDNPTDWGEAEGINMTNVKKLYLSNVGYDAETNAPVPVIGVVAAKKIDKKTHYLRVDDGELALVDGDYELDLLGNTWNGPILVTNGATLKVNDSKKYKKLTVPGDWDRNAPDGYSYTIKREKAAPETSNVTVKPTTTINGEKFNNAEEPENQNWGYDDTKLYGGYSLETLPSNGTIAISSNNEDKQGTAYYVGELTGDIQVGLDGDPAEGFRAEKGTLTVNDFGGSIGSVTVFNGTFTQNGAHIGTISSFADSSADIDSKYRTVSKITINKTAGDAENIENLANDGALKKGETVKIKAGKFTGDNPAKLGSDDINTIGTVAETGNADGTVFTVGSASVDGGVVGYALNGAVTCTAAADTYYRIATTKNPCGEETATAGTTLKAKAANRVSYAVITNKITYTDIVGDKENKNQVSYDTLIVADGGYNQQTDDADDVIGTYYEEEESSNMIWDADGADATLRGQTKKINEYQDDDGRLGEELNELEAVEADDVAGNAGIVADGFTYERSIELNAYPQDTFAALEGLEDVDTDKGITYFTKDPSAYTEDSYGIAVLDGEKWIISGDASDFDKSSELAAVSKKAEKSIEIKRVDGHLNDDGKIDNSSAGVAFEMDPKKADTLKISAPADVVVASTLDVTNGREAADNFYTVYVYGLDASLGAASDFGVDSTPVELQDITFTVRQIPAKASVVVTDIAKGVDVETATGIEYYALYDSADAEEADYNFGATDDVIAALHKAIEGESAEFNSGVVYVSDGIEGSFVKVADAVKITADDAARFNSVANATAGYNDWNVTANVAVYRLYNKNNGEHLFITKTNQAEVDFLVAQGWENDGIKWKAPKTSELPVYRAYNPNSGLHYYTANKGEYDILVSMGWSADQGISFYSAAATASPIYCEYNVNDGTHNYTADKPEHDYLLSIGWTENAVTFYGVK